MITHFLNKLEELVWYLELDQANKFKIAALKRAHEIIQNLEQSQFEAVRLGATEIAGIGSGIRQLMQEFATTQNFSELTQLYKKYPRSLRQLSAVGGLGACRIRQIWEGSSVRSLKDLLAAVENFELSHLKGFSESFQKSLAQKARYILENQARVLLPAAVNRGSVVLERLLCHDPTSRFAGEIARHLETIGKVQITTQVSDNLIPEILSEFSPRRLSDGHWEVFQEGTSIYVSNHLKAFGDLTWTDQLVAESLIETIPPALWEKELSFLWKNQTSRSPWSEKDFQGCFHCHTTFSDGAHSVEQMVEAARTKGWSYLAISDHSKTSYYANGMKEPTVQTQWKLIDELNGSFKGQFRIFKSCEVDILPDGNIDYWDSLAGDFDFLIASVHQGFNSGDQTPRVLKALDHPKVKMIGHVTGRLLLERPPYTIDVEAVIRKAANLNKIVELNCNPHRMDVDWRWAKLIHETGMVLSINPDAHSTAGLDDVKWGAMVGQKFGLPKEKILNTWPLRQVAEYLGCP